MKTNVWIIVNFLLCLNTPKLGIRQLFLKPLESWPSIVVGDGEWWWLWSLLVVHYTFRGTLLPQHFPLKNMGKALLPFSIGKALGVEYQRVFLKKSHHACGDRDEKLRGWLHPPHLRPNEGHYDDLTKTGNCPRNSLSPRPGLCASGHYTIFFLYQWNQLSILRGRLVSLKVLMMRIKSEEDCFCQDNILKV